MDNSTQVNGDQNQAKPTFKRKLRNYLIDPRYQLALLIGHLLILAAGFVVIYYQVQNSFYSIEQVAATKNIVTNPYYKQLVMMQENFILTTIYSTMIYCAVVAVVFTIVFSHKSAGAIYGLKKYFDDIVKDGWTRPLVFRKSDIHQELPVIVNEAIERIKRDKKD